ncbi:acyl-CoA thioesterase [Sphingomonas oryzagri]|jgi:acyl-CoA thioester hydrolase|uniref:Thioesterase family protein n=1 Tax=Sphingomonas oryzagri TaxID=3042314 RepID=A0ABT6MZ29_9SPHN|nr:thioesterase family protein [Sphingomonas oryzagri]MDH7638311.1 thioesterase family protein [Sphingomonas oryzagri]
MSRAPLRPRSAYRHWTPITTRWHDNDVYGHVNNTVYYGWFDTAVNAWLVETELLDVEAGDPIGLVVETGCRYAASLAFPQKVEVGLAVAKLGTSSVTYHLGIFAEGAADAAAEGHFTHVYVGRDSRRPVPLPADWRDMLERLI